MPLNNQNGFTIVQAIFIVVVLALMGTYMMTLSSVQQSTTTQAYLQAQVYQAARSGLEWGIKHVVDNKTCFATWSPGSAPNIDGCRVTVSCVKVDSYSEGSSVYGVYNLAAFATYGSTGTPEFVSRKLEVTIHD